MAAQKVDRMSFLFAGVLSLALAGCGGGGSDSGSSSPPPPSPPPPPPAPTYSIGGTVAGLGTGATVAVSLNGGAAQTISADGAFTFSGSGLASAASYTVTVATQPDGQTCGVTNGSGTVSSADVSDVAVACENSFHEYAVAINSQGSTLSVYATERASGSVVKRGGDFASLCCYPVSLAMHASGNLLMLARYAPSNAADEFGAALLRLNQRTGELTTADLLTGRSTAVAFNAAGTLAYVTVENEPPTLGSTVAVYPVDAAAGTLTLLHAPVDTGLLAPATMNFTADGSMLVMRDEFGVNVFLVGGDGSLSSNYAPLADPARLYKAVAMAPSGTAFHLLSEVVSGPSTGSVFLQYIELAADGGMTFVDASELGVAGGSNSLALHPTGNFLYLGNGATREVSAFTRSGTGALTPIAGATYAVGVAPSWIAVSGDGTRAMVANTGDLNVADDSSLSAFTVAADGTLSAATPATLTAGDSPVEIRFAP